MYGAPARPATDAMLTMRPHFAASIRGSTARVQFKAPLALTRSIWSHISSVVSVSLALAATPALFTRISGSPNPDRTRAIIASTFGRWVTSHRIASPRRPAARMAETVSSSSSAERAATATSAPSAARASATARPIPRPPPVTSAIRPASSAMSGLAQDGCQLCGIDVPAGHDAGHLSRARLSRQRHRQGDGAGAFRDHPISFGDELDGGADLIEGGRERSVEQVLGHREHIGENRLAADAVDERGPVIDHLRGPGLPRCREGRAGLGFNGVDPHRWLEGAERGRDPYREATATPRDEHAVKLGQILEQLEPDRAVAGHDPLVVERMDERPVDLRKAPVGERLPPAIEGDRDHAPSEPLDGPHLCLGRGIRSDHRASKAQPAGVPGNPLCHVSGAGGEDAIGQLSSGHQVHSRGGAPDLEGPDGLQVFELQEYLGGRIPHIQADQWRSDGGARDQLAGSTNILERQRHRLHIFTVWPVCVSLARRTTYAAEATSSTASPNDLNSVSSRGDRRPGFFPVRTSPSSACTWSFLTAPSSIGISRSPASASADSRRSTNRRAAAMVDVSISREVGIDDPTALMCTPSLSQPRCRIGSALAVTVATMSAPRTAASALASASTGKLKRDVCSRARAAARSGLRLQIRTRRSGRTAAIASTWVRA